MRPFFSYYGAKWRLAKHYGAPRHPLVIEPFAGSACYSLRWDVRRARLYDVNPDICDLWAWLIEADPAEVEAIPDTFDAYEEVARLS